ncbi:carboxylating nicotinate-nucleotide diphosphorylase [Candidatus Raskinella chloraquaticus]
MFMPELPSLIVARLVEAALLEDLGRAGDITSQATIAPGTTTDARLIARNKGILAGSPLATAAFHLAGPGLSVTCHLKDGDALAPGDEIAHISGEARTLLTAERTALNFLGRMSGIATLTRAYAQAIAHTRAAIVCTRKTTPGLRVVEKYAVRCGGGRNHRFGLDDAILIKDNHIAVAGGIRPALRRAKAFAGHLVAIEIEVDRLDQLVEALDEGVTAILLDNMSLSDMREAVRLTNGRAVLEASGNVTLHTVAAIAETGVDLISSGALTHSAPNFDVGLDIAL